MTKVDIDYKNNYFEYPELARLPGEPETKDLITLQRQIRANALTVHTVLGGGHHGHLGLVCNAQTYARIPNTQPYARPAAPGPLVPIPGATQFQIQQQRDAHAEETHLFREVLAVERTLIQQIVAAVEPKYLKALRDPVTNKINRTIPDILSHLFNAYGHVTAQELYDLKHKVETMNFQPTEPVDTLITEIDDLADIAELAGSPITDKQRVDIGYIVLQRCKPFKTGLREWNALPNIDQTWATFKTHFRDVQIALRKTGEISIEEGLNHTTVVNMVTEGIRAAFSEHEPVLEQANNVAEAEQLRQQVKEMQQLLEQMNAAQQPSNQQPRMNTPDQQHFHPTPYQTRPTPYQQHPFYAQANMYQPNSFVQPHWNNNFYPPRSGRGGRGRSGRGGRGGRGSNQRERKYCWTHGLAGHNGKECNYPSQGHKAEATLENRMGGSEKGCHS